ncbi:MAG: M16 family metallopeptidase [Sphingomonadales bacterium]
MKSAITKLFVGLCLIGTNAQAQDYKYDLPIKEHIFENGLRLLVIERPGDKRVASKIWTDMGALNEIPGEYGSAHYLEHLMFKGTQTLGADDWEKEKPLIDEINDTEKLLIAELNRSRNAIRERGVFHDYKNAETTPELIRLQKHIDDLEEQVEDITTEGTTMKWYQGFGGTKLTAVTEQEFMHFDIDLPANRVEIFLRIEADRMTNTIFRKFDAERMILVEQRIGFLNQLPSRYMEAMDALVGRTSNVYIPEGYMSDFKNYTRVYERYLYDTYFIPNNTTLIFVGGVTMDEMIPKVEKYFGGLERKPEPMRYYGQEPLPSGEKRLTYRDDKLTPRIELRYQIPGVGHPDRPNFDVVMEAVGNRLQKQLGDQNLSRNVNSNTLVVHTSIYGLPSSMHFAALNGDPSKLDAIEKAMLSEIENLSNNSITNEELKFAQKTLRSKWYRLASDPNALSNYIGHFEVMDSWKTLKPYLEARDKTTAEDVRRLVEQYFSEVNRSIGRVLPKEKRK